MSAESTKAIAVELAWAAGAELTARRDAAAESVVTSPPITVLPVKVVAAGAAEASRVNELVTSATGVSSLSKLLDQVCSPAGPNVCQRAFSFVDVLVSPSAR